MIAETLYRRTFGSASLFALALAIRVTLIGLAPHADEGHYAAASYFQYLGYTKGLFTADSVIPAFGIIELYSLLVSWIYFIPAEPYFLLRLADALIAAFSGVMIYKYLYLVTNRRLPAYLASILLIVAINHPDFIEAGARNPIPIATLLLFCAIYLLERDSGAKLLLPACCLAASVLVREPFLMFAGVVVLFVWQQRGFRTAARFCCLAAVFGTLVILLVAALRGGVSGAVAMYDAYAHTPATNSDFNLTLLERIERGMGQGKRILLLLSFCMPVLLLGLCAPLFEPTLRTKKALSLYIFGIGLTLAPLTEVLIKKPYSYHLAQMFIGTGIFASYGFYAFFLVVRKIRHSRPINSWLLAGFVALGHVFLIQDYARTMRYAAGWSLHFAPVMVLGDWSSSAVKDSYYLQIASIVRQYSRPGDAILSTSYNVFPLTGRIPLSRRSASLSVYRLMANGIKVNEEIAGLIRERQPAVFVEEQAVLLPPRKRIDVIGNQVADLYGLSIDVGPGLSPYRQFSAKVHVAHPALSLRR
ncbi:MAG: hypothetical protein Q7T21_15445 [Gallionella sp.]|nr:hypothetical protein [Gallionella sp.]